MSSLDELPPQRKKDDRGQQMTDRVEGFVESRKVIEF
jgi:hypothetical protein